MGVFKYNPVDFLFTCFGLVFMLLDIGLDVWAVVCFYQEKAYVCLGFLLFFLLGSSVLVQAFSWLWYSYEDFDMKSKVESLPTRGLLKFLHFLQLGIYFRHAGVVEVSLRSFRSRNEDPEGIAVFLSHDLSLLRLIETFSESAPQLVLMLTIIVQRWQLDPVTVLKACGSASAVAFSVTMYHRSLRSFLPGKQKQQLVSSVVYFLWNFLLISSRLVALALFASVLTCFILTHFFCSWMVLFLFVCRAKTDLMDSACGEWLYRATVGLIWYFDWFNVVEGRTRNRTLFYHSYMLADISLLCGLWCWQISRETPLHEMPQLYAIITAVTVVSVYILGLLFKIIYYMCYHPNLSKDDLDNESVEKSREGQGPRRTKELGEDVTDYSIHVETPQTLILMSDGKEDEVDSLKRSGYYVPDPTSSAPCTKRCNKRMRKLAENFYC